MATESDTRTNVARGARPGLPERPPMDEDAWELIRREQEKTKERELVRFSFYRVDPAWRRLEADDKARHRDELVDLVARHARELMVFSYSMIGTRGDCDFLLWQAARDVAPLHDLEAGIRATGLGAYLSLPHSFFSMTRRSIYVNRYEEEYVARYGGDEPLDRARIALNPEGARYLFVYPFVKTREWYALPAEERQRMMDEHIHVGHRWPDVKLNTTYSYGLDDQEFVVAFETDHIGRFLDLLMELRLTDASRYTLRDTPSFTCISMPLERCLEALG